MLGPTTRAATPAGARTITERKSIPLHDLLVPFLKLSNNMHAEILIKAMGRASSNQGTWDAGIAAMSKVLPGLGIDIDLFTPIFAVSRISGWAAHVIEQLDDNRLIRPRADYVGPAYPEKYVALEQRK